MRTDVELPFANRTTAGRLLARRLEAMALPDPVVLALPRGGVPVAAEIARALHAPLDVLLVRKIGAPHQPELAVGAVLDGERPEIVIERRVAADTRTPLAWIREQAGRELREIERRRALYVAGREPEPVAGRTAIVVDDGIATGATVRVALKGLRRRHPARLVVAAPVAPPSTVAALRREADAVVCLAQPAIFGAIGFFYRDFHPLHDDEVIEVLAAFRPPGRSAAPA